MYRLAPLGAVYWTCACVHAFASLTSHVAHVVILAATGLWIRAHADAASDFIDARTRQIFAVGAIVWIADIGCAYMSGAWHIHWLFHVLFAVMAHRIIDRTFWHVCVLHLPLWNVPIEKED